ncbi:hypothetical protein OPKNFCMD_3797 [Methylobacterium crusticola]|uniref:Glycosyltransferase 61 catalytic domain-containing protein n=1 Tax=Methylobacterium crusticola TaxID=1697972 RepID=A0ABQ4R068_9HYPH|nr:glycosyltransferase 61 family protein [Methylobacterium crusticola]GJD51046.1 hypothetical protein OPKNFCMD_3797 [Methylobacterium crusticola]
MLELINVRDAYQIASLPDAVRTSYGYVRCAGPELPEHALELICYQGMISEEWYRVVNGRQYEIPSIGCQALPGAAVYGPGHILHKKSLIVEGNLQDKVAIEWADRDYGFLANATETRVSSQCLSFLGPGHLIYGHWIVDFLPRLYVARMVFGSDFFSMPVLWPSNTPSWAENIVHTLFGRQLKLIRYDISTELVQCDHLWVPTYPYSADHHFHSCVRGLYDPFRPDTTGWRKLCVSRARIEGKSAGATKNFKQRAFFEERAQERGFEVIFPEELSFKEQISMFNEARVVIGEFGSALHSSVFCGGGTVVGAVNCLNPIQSRICTLFKQRCSYLIPSEQMMEDGVIAFSCTEDSIVNFLDAICTASSA